MTLSLLTAGLDPEVLKDTVQKDIGATVLSVDLVGKNEYCKTVNITLENNTDIIARIMNSSYPSWVMESEYATLKYIRAKTSIPVPNVLHVNITKEHPLGVYMFLEKIPGVKLSTLFSNLSLTVQDTIVEQIATWMMELFQHRFSAIGSLYLNKVEDNFTVGQICQPAFYANGRDKLDLNRGPFVTVRDFFLACAQRELDCARTQSIQDASDKYQKDVEDARFTVERSMALLTMAIAGCQGLDEEDPDTKEFSLSLSELNLTNIYVSPENPMNIVSFPFWFNTTTRPLWHCASLPTWLRGSLSGQDGIDTDRLQHTFYVKIQKLGGVDNLFLRTLGLENTRRAIDEICEYDAFTDGFLLLPTLESIIATLPGKEDLNGLRVLLDPNTLEGRAARIALLTKGVGALSLAVQGMPSVFQHTGALPQRPIMPRVGSGSSLLS